MLTLNHLIHFDAKQFELLTFIFYSSEKFLQKKPALIRRPAFIYFIWIKCLAQWQNVFSEYFFIKLSHSDVNSHTTTEDSFNTSNGFDHMDSGEISNSQ